MLAMHFFQQRVLPTTLLRGLSLHRRHHFHVPTFHAFSDGFRPRVPASTLQRRLPASCRHSSTASEAGDSLRAGITHPDRLLTTPRTALRGSAEDVKAVLPFLYQLSFGAARGTPGWCPSSVSLGQGTLTARPRADSWLEITFPFSSDEALRERYRLADGDGLRVGLFLEELDAFSADCAMRHADGLSEARRLTVVTAAHDGLSMLKRLRADMDLRLRGCVVSVGVSSMEVQTDLLQVRRRDGVEVDEEYLGSTYTVMVARSRDGSSRAQVHPLLEEDAVSAAVSRHAVDRQSRRRALAATALAHTPPGPSEVPLLHELWRSSQEPSDGFVRVRMSETEQRALDIMQPMHRNMNGFMFGGYLMRRALEVAWLSAYRFCKRPACFAGLDDVVFKKPVEVGVLLEYVGRTVFAASDGSIRVLVEAQKKSLKTGRVEPTNAFHFKFVLDESAARAADGEVQTSQKQVQPDTYEEGMVYLEGRRRWLCDETSGHDGMDKGVCETVIKQE